jgi:ACS family pantothenate transporter-like MFS transporter
MHSGSSSNEKVVVQDTLLLEPSDEWQPTSIEMSPLTQEPLTRYIDRIQEQELVHRLDKRLLLFAMFGNLVKALDNTNLSSAFISGMEEELNVTGIQYNWMNVLFVCGYLT